MMSLYGETFERLIRKTGKELAPEKERAERDACREQFMRTFDFRLAGQEVAGGRPSWVIDATPVPNSAPRCGDLKTLSKFHFKIWIDQTESRWARFEADSRILPVDGK